LRPAATYPAYQWLVGLNELVRLGFPHSTLSSLNCIISSKFNKFIKPIHPIKLRPFAAKQQSISSQTEVQQQRSPNLQSQFNLFAMNLKEENTSGELMNGILLADWQSIVATSVLTMDIVEMK